MNQETIAFIGCGNMGGAIVKGLIADNYPKEKLWATNVIPEQVAYYQSLGINATENNIEAIKRADIVVLSVKPQQMQSVAESIESIVQEKKPLIVSIAVGITTGMLTKWLGGNLAIVRSMPNTPALIGSGAAGLYATELVTQDQKNFAESIHRAVGVAIWVEAESMIDVVASLSGSGPAYFFYVIEAMRDVAIAKGLNEKDANLLALQTAFGSSKLALESSEDVVELRRRVTSPKGTTEQAIKTFDDENMKATFGKAMHNAIVRAEELVNELT